MYEKTQKPISILVKIFYLLLVDSCMEWRQDDHPDLYMFCAHDLDLSDRGTVLKAAVDIISTAEWHNIKTWHIPFEN